MRTLGALLLIALAYTVGLDAVYDLLDAVDATVKTQYRHATEPHGRR